MELNGSISLDHVIKANCSIKDHRLVIGYPEATSFEEVYDMFLNTKVTDDLFVELTVVQMLYELQNLLLDAIPYFEFPRFNIYDYTLGEYSIDETGKYTDASYFGSRLTREEINILAVLMKIAWIRRQTASVEVTRMKYSGPDFKLSSQANHLNSLLKLQESAEREDRHAQRLYRRRKTTEDGYITSNWSSMLNESALD